MNAKKRALIVCPSLGKACGIGEYSRHTMMALAAAGWETKGVRTIREAVDELGNEASVDVIVVQHEYGLWQRDRLAAKLSEGESTADLVAGLRQIHESDPNVGLAVICHTVLGGFHDDTALLIRSGVPLFALHREGARILSGEFLELGVPPVEGFVPSAPRSLTEPLAIGAFGMFVATKGIDSVVELCRRLNAKLIICSYCRTPEDRCTLKSLVKGLDACVYDKFLSDKEALDRLSPCDLLYMPQGQNGECGARPRIFSASASVRMMLNLRRPIIVNRFWGYDELLSALPVADSVDEAATHVREMHRHPLVYRSWVEKIDQFAEANRLSDKVPAVVSGLHSSPRPAISIPAVGDEPRVTHENVAEMTDSFIRRIPNCPESLSGRGIVICAGGLKYNPSAWVLIRMLRHLGCSLPIQVWYRGDDERDESWMKLVQQYGVECIDAEEVRMRHPHPALGGWELKPYAILHSRFQEVMLLDADNVPARDPTYLFDTPEFRATGALFWPDGCRTPPTDACWQAFGVEYRDEPDFESGQLMIDKARCWRAITLCNWYNEHSHFFYRVVYGDKDTFRFAWHRLGQTFAMPKREMGSLSRTLLQYDPAGELVFQHRCGDKWRLAGNQRIAGFQHEEMCHAFMDELRQQWQALKRITERLSAADLQDIDEMAGARFELIRPGFNRWPVQLDRDGYLEAGSTSEFFVWWMERGQLVLAGDDGRPTCRLIQSPAGVWESRSLRNPRICVRLVRQPPIERAESIQSLTTAQV